MQAKLFDPFTEDAVNAWLATTPVKVVNSAHLFDTSQGGTSRQVALVFYEEERELGFAVPAAVARESPLFDLLDPFFHPECLQRARGSSAGDN